LKYTKRVKLISITLYICSDENVDCRAHAWPVKVMLLAVCITVGLLGLCEITVRCWA